MAKQKPAVKINDLIFKELIKRGYALEGKTRVWNIADSKLWYLTPEQSQGYLDLDSDESYKIQTGQPQAQDLVKDNIDEILEKIEGSPVNIIDLGCGDGEKAVKLIQQLRILDHSLKIRYCPIDISGYMVQRAIETISKLNVDEIIESQYNISDFENLDNITPLLRKEEYKTNLILLLGNTMGNFDIHELLYEIRTAMGDKDVFLVDTAIDDGNQEERAEAYRKNKRVNNWLIHIPTQLGLLPEEVELGVRFRNGRIEAYYTVLVNKLISFQEKKLQFNQGDQIITVVAYKHGNDDLHTYFNLYFKEVSVRVSKDKSKALILCKK